MLDSPRRKLSGPWILAGLALAALLLVVASASQRAWAAEEEPETVTAQPAAEIPEGAEALETVDGDELCAERLPEGAEEKAGPFQCCTYKEWTYYAEPSHTTVVGGRDRFCCSHRTYSNGQQTQYCDWIVAGCPDDPPGCPNGIIETGSSNNCSV